MRIYETIYICPPNLDEEGRDEFADLVHEVIYDAGGKIIKQERWGKRRLAYKVGAHQEGIYYYFLYGGDGRTKTELEHRLKLAEECIRFLTVRLDDELKGRKHKIYTREELQLALQMDKPKRTKPKPKPEPAAAADSAEEAVIEDQPPAEAVDAGQETPEAEAPVAEATAEPETSEGPPTEEAAESSADAADQESAGREDKPEDDVAAESTKPEAEPAGGEEEEGK